MNKQDKITLDITLVTTSDNTFDVEIFEPGTGFNFVVNCHDSGKSVTSENKQITDEIRSWITLIRENESL